MSYLADPSAQPCRLDGLVAADGVGWERKNALQSYHDALEIAVSQNIFAYAPRYVPQTLNSKPLNPNPEE